MALYLQGIGNYIFTFGMNILKKNEISKMAALE
jgi:hypothetical protein